MCYRIPKQLSASITGLNGANRGVNDGRQIA